MTQIHWTQGPKASFRSKTPARKAAVAQTQPIDEVEFHPAIKLVLVCGLSACMWAVIGAGVVRLMV
ncbi:MAG: hypothetical protein EON59_17580 [Alphaproteobacteria bacterium]|nr:MAG: hypothetical protein EON59_17580 [Alphaproteobacteria bacterium]